MNTFSKVKAWLSKTIQKLDSSMKNFIDMNTFKHFLLAAGIVGGAFLIEFTTHDYGETKATYRMTKLLKYSIIFPDSIATREGDFRSVLISRRLSDSLSYVSLPLPTVVNCKVKRIHQQLTDVALKSHNHFTVAKEFMVQSFVCITTSAVFFVIAAVSLAFITKAGFAQANPYLITLLICSLAVGSFFISLTNIFKQEKNANDNLNLYIRCINLEQAIRSELVTNKFIIVKANQPCDTLDRALDYTITSIDKRMEEINQIALGFDAAGVKILSTLDLPDLGKP